MADKMAISVKGVSKSFKLPHERHTSVKGALIGFFRSGHRSYERQQVLQNISFEIKEGEFFGIVGRNGSGKSTLLKLLAGIYYPDNGQITINGKLTPFIELGVGFNPELTGRENVYLNGALLGLNRREMDVLYDDIVSFAELERFMDQKLKNYSSGMQVRLAFSIAIRARSDILLIDEVLAVGDAIFQRKCFNYFKELKKAKQTVVLVSHDSSVLQEYCDSGILIEKGKIVKSGPIDGVIKQYVDILNKYEAAQDEVAQDSESEVEQSGHWGSGEVVVEKGRAYLPANGNKRTLFTDEDDTIGLSVTYKASTSVGSPVYGITVQDAAGKQVFASNTQWMHMATSPLHKEGQVTVSWQVPNVFNTGDYSVAPAVADETGSVIYDWRESVIKFKVRKQLHSNAVINVDHSIAVEDANSIQ